MARADTVTGLKPAYSFDQLVIGPNNHVAAAACREVVKAPGEMYNPLVIYGPAGVGKTHLMQAVAHEMLLKNPGFQVKYISAERFMNDIVTAIAEDRIVDLRKTYSTLDLLIIDDVQYLVESKIAQEELFHIFNNMHQDNRQVILAADRTPNQLATLSKGIRSRLEWGLSTDVQPPDEPTRVEILRRKQAAQGLAMPDEMLVPVAQSLRSNVRELEGFLKRMHAYLNLSHQTLSIDLVKAVIQELAPAADAASNGATLQNESPGLSPAPGVAPELTRVLNVDGANGNGAHKNGHARNGAHKNGDAKKAEPVIDLDALAAAAKSRPPVEEPAAPPAPKPKAAPAKEEAPKPAAKAEPAKEEAPKPAPIAPVIIPEGDAPPAEEVDGEGLPAGHKEVTAVFFYPEGKTEALETIHRKFQDVIKKHKLKFRLKRVHDEAYVFKGKIDYAKFANACKNQKALVAIVVGPPPESLIPEQDFYDPLTVALNGQGVSLQLVNWGELNKDYRYLNLALDIALVRSK